MKTDKKISRACSEYGVEEILTKGFKREFIRGVYEIARPEPRNDAYAWCEKKFQDLVEELANLINTEVQKAVEEGVRGFVKFIKEQGKDLDTSFEVYLQESLGMNVETYLQTLKEVGE